MSGISTRIFYYMRENSQVSVYIYDIYYAAYTMKIYMTRMIHFILGRYTLPRM